MIDPRPLFASLFQAAVAAADPERVLPAFLPRRPKGRTLVVGFGKAAAQMAAVFDRVWDAPLEGLVVTPYGHAVPCGRIAVVEAAHPIPDEAGLKAAQSLFALLRGLSAEDLVVALASGGGSALLPAPLEGMSLADEVRVNAALLASGAPIAAMNLIRKQLSAIKGGRLALAAHPAKVVTLVLSDVPGDDPALVASGPTVAGKGGRAEALAAAQAYGMDLPEAAMRILRGEAAEPPRPEDPRLRGHEVHVIASAGISLAAAEREARRFGLETAILSEALEGEAREAGGFHAALALEIAQRGRPFSKPRLLLSGGETSVTLRRKGGKGGRNTEFLLALALKIQGVAGIHAFAADTDGRDGSEGNAGAFADGTSADRMRAAGLDPAARLAENDAWSAFHAVGDLFATGPTGTNVNDLRLVLVADGAGVQSVARP